MDRLVLLKVFESKMATDRVTLMPFSVFRQKNVLTGTTV